jgi:hypothetical protein
MARGSTPNNWCGILVIYCPTQGISCYWGINCDQPVGIIRSTTTSHVYGSSGLASGDVGVATSRSHHYLIEEVVEDYDYVACLEGNGDPPSNAQWMGGVLTAKTRTLAQVAWYYRIYY